MKRRSFLAALFAAPMVPAVVKAGEEAVPFAVGKIRFSQEKDGHLSLNAANLGEVATGRILSADGRSVFDLGAGTFTIRA